MRTVGAFTAKTNLSRLLHEVQSSNEEIIIRRHNRNVAYLGPIEKLNASQSVDLVKEFSEIRDKTRGKRETVKSMVNEGRKR